LSQPTRNAAISTSLIATHCILLRNAIMHMTSRELVRRWYGQVKGQPEAVAKELRSTVAHTIIPSTSRFSFGETNFVPLSSCIDLVLHSESNTAGDIAAITLRGYRSSYDPETNQLTIGGPNNFLFSKDLKLRPYRGATNRAIDSDSEPALLLAALEMEAEREASMRSRAIMRLPRLADAILSFETDKAPKFEVTDGLRDLTLFYLDPDSMPMRGLCAPANYKGKVNRIVRDIGLGLILVELFEAPDVSPMSLVFEIPSWGQVHVKTGQEVCGGMQLASMNLSAKILDPMYVANRNLNSLWDAIVSYVGPRDMDMMLRRVWDSEVFKWAGMTMIPNHILTTDHPAQACAVWRDLRNSLGRVCHSHRNPSEVIRSGKREGRIAVWDSMTDPLEDLSMTSCGVDLTSLPDVMFERCDRNTSDMDD
jgi:hypothetical protein